MCIRDRYEPVKSRSDSYQSEAALEKEFIRLLCEQGYEYLTIHTEKELIANLRLQLENLNNYTSVSYTHLDVYKRQGMYTSINCWLFVVLFVIAFSSCD